MAPERGFFYSNTASSQGALKNTLAEDVEEQVLSLAVR